jgi:hypothetical protein
MLGKQCLVMKDVKGKGSASPKYRQVQISSLDKSRKGKHHELTQGIVRELQTLKAGAALVVPFEDVEDIGLANLRSAVHRASTAAGIKIQTLADEKNFYVWAADESHKP